MAGRCGRGGRTHQFHVIEVGPFVGVGVGAEPNFAPPVCDCDARNLHLHPVEGSGEGTSHFGCAEAAGVELALRLAAAAFRCMVPRSDDVFFGLEFRTQLWDKFSTAAPAQRRQYGALFNTARKAYKA